MQTVIANTVGDHLTCEIRGCSYRQITGSVLECIEGSTDQVALLQIDFAKDFDKVEHQFFLPTTARSSVRECVTPCYSTLLYTVHYKVTCNHILSDKIQLQSSDHQGCPLSPYFSLYLEPPCLSMLCNPNIKGYRYGEEEMKSSSLCG